MTNTINDLFVYTVSFFYPSIRLDLLIKSELWFYLVVIGLFIFFLVIFEIIPFVQKLFLSNQR